MVCKRLSIIVPVYNEAQTIGQVLDRIEALDLAPLNLEKEVIVVDDCSTDGSTQIVGQHIPKSGGNRIAHLSIINLGKGAAVRFGFRHATGDIVLIQDADLELDPSELLKLVEPVVKGQADVVYGSRFARRSQGIPRRTRVANWTLTKITNVLFGCRLTDMETAYKVFRRDVLRKVALRCVQFDIEPEITARILQAGYAIVEVPISYRPRRSDEGKKISWTDGVDAVYTLLRCRFVAQRGGVAMN